MVTPVDPNKRQRIYLNLLPEYEMKLLTALAFFLNRKVSSQAAAALCMYIRQSHDRILTQCEYYADQLGLEDKWDLLNLIYEDPEKARKMLDQRGDLGDLHKDETDVYSEDE